MNSVIENRQAGSGAINLDNWRRRMYPTLTALFPNLHFGTASIHSYLLGQPAKLWMSSSRFPTSRSIDRQRGVTMLKLGTSRMGSFIIIKHSTCIVENDPLCGAMPFVKKYPVCAVQLRFVAPPVSLGLGVCGYLWRTSVNQCA